MREADDDGRAPLGAALSRLRAAREAAPPGQAQARASAEVQALAEAAAETEGKAAEAGAREEDRDKEQRTAAIAVDPDALAQDLRDRLADRKDANTAARYSAAAYAALHGHVPGGDEAELGSRPGRRRWALRPRTALVAAVAVLLLGTGVTVAASWPGDDVEELTAVAATEPGAPAASAADPEAAGSAEPSALSPAAGAPSAASGVVVDVVGQVQTPGLVTLPAGSRVADAVTAAGGATDGAELSAVNLARPLVDGEQLRIPAPGETVTPPPGAVVGAGPAGAPATGAPATGLVNLNTADATTLETLPGVGAALAGRILDWRQQNGPFASVDELDEVSGIGPAMLAKVRDLVTV